MRRAYHSRPRGAFTLVELLVVITILGILFALTAAAVVRAIVKGDEVKSRNELSQLTNAVKSFQNDFQVPYVPDTLALPPGNDQASAQFITTLWPRLKGNGALLANTATARAYWQTGSQQRVLAGHQVLVFVLGGYREGAGANGVGGDPAGFSSDATDPMKAPVASAGRKGPYYEFPSERLKVISTTSDFPYPSFIDVYGKAPYLYFSSSTSGNDYPTTAVDLTYQTDTGATGTFRVSPYLLRAASTGVTAKFANPTGFQIISAGRDGRFGKGGINWGGGTGTADKDGYDDVANFHPTLLGIASN
ncbi:MAG: type II secretion system protein [Gemmataceae bacterium]